jgi:hypothetical protein
MLTAHNAFEDDPVSPECRATVARIQSALDGAVPGSRVSESLDSDPHPAACPACRERVRTARVLLSVLAAPAEPVAVPDGFADRVVKAMWEERHARTRRRTYGAMAGLIAAALLVALGWYLIDPPAKPQPPVFVKDAIVSRPPEAPAPREKTPTPTSAPDPRPIHLGDEVAKAGQAILDTPKPLAESVAVAPKLFDALTSPLKLSSPPADPMATALEPARRSLAELPLAAQASLEPVTGTAEKALNRFLRDVGSVKPNS